MTLAGLAIYAAAVKDIIQVAPPQSEVAKATGRPTAPNSVTPTAAQPETWGGKWRLAKSASSFDDSTTVVLSVESDETLTGWPGRTAKPLLVLRCKEGKTDAYIRTGMPGKIAFGEYGSDEGIDIRMRYDKGEVFEYRMPASTDKEAYFFREPIPEIKFMLKHDRLLVELCPFNSSPQEFYFDLRKLHEVLPDLRSTCRW